MTSGSAVRRDQHRQEVVAAALKARVAAERRHRITRIAAWVVGVLVVAGPHRSGRTALLLTIAGRAHADAGTLKVAGLVAPVRARDIRRAVAFARLARTTDPVDELRQAFAARTPVVAIDDLDAVGDPVLRRAVHDELAFELRTAAAENRPVTLVVSAQTAEAVHELLPVPPTATLTLAAAPDLAKVL